MDNLTANRQKIAHSCYVQFQFIYTDLKNAEKKAADYCLENPDIVASESISTVAKNADCSEATLVRLAKHLGYGGYHELRKKIVCNDSEEITTTIGLAPDLKGMQKNNIQEIINSVIDSSIQSLQDSKDSIDSAQLESAINAILKAGKILFAASGDATTVALTGSQKLSRLGFPAFFNTDLDAQLITLAQMKKDDVFVCISHSGRTKNIYELAKIAKAKGITILALTSFPASPIAKIADLKLVSVSFTQDIMGEIITKRVPALCIIEIIYICLLLHASPKNIETLEAGNSVLAENKI